MIFRRTLVAGVLILGIADRPLAAGDWQLAIVPALSPGRLGDWDDFLVAAPSIVRAGEVWSMYYTGGRLDESGLSTAIGWATSPDGVTWTKHEPGAVLKGEWGRGALPDPPRLELASICRRPQGDLVMLVRERDVRRGNATFRFYNSRDGAQWEAWPEAGATLIKSLGTASVLSCALDCEQEPTGWLSLFCLVDRNDPEKRELWRLLWLKSNKWSEPAARPIEDVVRGAAVRNVASASSGGFRLLAGLIEPAGPDKPWRTVFRVSRDVRSWRDLGPPDLVIPGDGRPLRATAPRVALLPDADGTRLFYEFSRANGAVEIRSAFCPGAAYRSGQ